MSGTWDRQCRGETCWKSSTCKTEEVTISLKLVLGKYIAIKGGRPEVAQICVQLQASVLVASELRVLLPESCFIIKMDLLEMGGEDMR